MKGKNKKGIFGFFAFLLLLPTLIILTAENSTAVRIGIGPAYINIDYEPKLEREYQARLYSADGAGFNASISVSGKLARYITLNQSFVEIKPGETVVPFTFAVRLPENIEPGNYESEISATVLSAGGGTVSTATAVAMQVYMTVLSEKYLSVETEISGENEKTITLIFTNIGQKRIENASAEIGIYENSNLIKTILVSTFSIGASEKKTVKKGYSGNPGRYLAKIIVRYDGEEKLLAKGFELGKPEIRIKTIEIPNFEFGKINRINAKVESNWNENITASPKIEISKAGHIIAGIRANPVTVEKEAEIDFYWDASNVPEDSYDARLVLNYENGISEKEFIINVDKKSAYIGSRKSMISANILLAAGIFIVFVLLFLFIAKAVPKAAGKIRGKGRERQMEALILESARLAEMGHAERAAEIYSEIRERYENLPEVEKRIFRERILRLYRFIEEEFKGGRGKKITIE
ncbi:MAG: hypothetical protein NTV63_02345 [Candidatus Woesearchaeota archaeon]|nr:hypothetical protein [Candidatus Woesearchaeota archaeon]